MKKRIYFGTDGIRGMANVDPMTVETMVKAGRASACVFRRDNDRRHIVIVGKDTRLSGYMFETSLASGLCSMGVDVILVGPIPTPGIAYLTTTMRADAGIVISASHNPYFDNGIKFFGPDGFKLPESLELTIEDWMQTPEKLDKERPDADQIGRAKRLDDARGRYITYLKQNFPRDCSLTGVRIVMDCAHGATYKIAPAVFEELGADIVSVGIRPNGKNINHNCGALFPERLSKLVLDKKANIGIAFDGDGDRIVVCDEQGRIFDGDDLLGILAKPMHFREELGKGVVGTIMSNFGLERWMAEHRIDFFRASVGDRYVVEKMKETGSLLGGEPSGHVVSLSRSTTGDGILTALLLLGELCTADQPLSSYYGYVKRYPQEIRNVKVQERKVFDEIPSLVNCIRCAKTKLDKNGRVLVRYSGTEPKARVMVEGDNPEVVKKLADDIAAVIQSELGVS